MHENDFLRNDDEMFHLMQTFEQKKNKKIIQTKQNLPKILPDLSIEMFTDISIEISLAISLIF